MSEVTEKITVIFLYYIYDIFYRSYHIIYYKNADVEMRPNSSPSSMFFCFFLNESEEVLKHFEESFHCIMN